MACAFKCDRCGKYYDNSTSSIGPTIYKSKNTRILDLCKECKASLTDWLNQAVNGSCCEETAVFCEKNDYGYPKHVEGFIKSCSFKAMCNQCSIKSITVKRFVEALEEYFDYKWNEDDFHMPDKIPSKTVEEFVFNMCWDESNIYSPSLSSNCLMSNEAAKEALKRYFNYEWSDEIYDKY